MKLLPMNPAPPVTSSFISAPRNLPDVFAREVPRQTTLVARRRLRREVQIGEINDAAGALAEIAHAVRDAGRDDEQSGRAVAEHEPLPGAVGARALAHVEQQHQ